MKRVVLLLVLSLAGCAGQNPTGPDLPIFSVGGTLPTWMFVWQGRLIRPASGTYSVYLPPAIAGDAELAAHADRVLQAANDLGGRGGIRFTLSSDPKSAIQIRGIDPNHPNAVGNRAWGTLQVDDRFRCIGIRDLGFSERRWFLSNALLHEVGHFLFGPGHSDNPADIMNPNRSDYVRLNFSVNEFDAWQKSLQFPAGSKP